MRIISGHHPGVAGSLASLLAEWTRVRPVVLDLQQRQGMQRHTQVDLAGTAVEDRADPDNLPLALLCYLHNLTHRPTRSGDVLNHQDPFPRYHLETPAQRHHAALTLAENGAYPQGPSDFLSDDNPAYGWGNHH